MVATIPLVADCKIDACSYNHNGCNAFAVTVGSTSNCTTFIPLEVRGGVEGTHAKVGACKRADCTHNESLSCTAPAINIGQGQDAADCLTFTVR